MARCLGAYSTFLQVGRVSGFWLASPCIVSGKCSDAFHMLGLLQPGWAALAAPGLVATLFWWCTCALVGGALRGAVPGVPGSGLGWA